MATRPFCHITHCSSKIWVCGQWITGGVVYGEAFLATTKPVRARTEALLQELTRQVVHLTGPRFVAGDFNQEMHHLQEVDLWKRQGFIDLQDLACIKWNLTPAATCKGSTRKDFVFISPELRDLLLAVRLDNEAFPDHAILSGSFRPLCQPEKVRIWRRPQPFAVPPEVQKSLSHSDMAFHVSASDPTEVYHELCHQYEQALRAECLSKGQAGPRPCQLGRGQSTHLSTVVSDRCPIKSSRLGERVPAVNIESLMYRRCFTQLRRLVNFARMKEHGASPNAAIHRLSLWSAICQAPFEGSFSKWWARNLTDPAHCQFPQHIPPQAIAKQLASDFESFVCRLEQDLIASRRAAAQKRRQTDANRVFRDIRAPGPEPISSLAQCREAKVTSIEAEDSFCFEPRCAFDAQMQLSHAQGHCSLVECEDGQAWVSGPLPEVGGVVYQHGFLGSLQTLHSEFESAWAKRWNKHDEVPPDFWDRVDAVISRLFSPLPSSRLVITVDMFRAFVRSRKPRSAV
ncbi:unnamed protein product [Durusdinium trenchii]|uniref:Endonuclease/exonuclease/phosphatase domain-containing protein n=1 Tax=Durusdinium trenchii TaxID=1381693 RepID=A0ABP0PPS9_9DINO